jgi:hypothetical protein
MDRRSRSLLLPQFQSGGIYLVANLLSDLVIFSRFACESARVQGKSQQSGVGMASIPVELN